MSHPFQVPLPHNVVYMRLALLRRHAPLVYKTLPVRKLVLDFLTPFSEACHRHALPFRQLQQAVIACGSLSKEICVARNITEAPHPLSLHTLKIPNTVGLAFCHAIVPHGLRLRVFGNGRIRVAHQSLCFGLLLDSNIEYDASVRLTPEGSKVCERISWDDVFHADEVLASSSWFNAPLSTDRPVDGEGHLVIS